jgi:ketosteroid isomerase-like protein
MEASINHDIKTLRVLTHEDIVWYLGSDTLKGKEAALTPHGYDAGLKTTLHYSNVIVKGDTVRFDLLETNEQVQFFGMEALRMYPQFIFKDGLVYRKMPWKRSGDVSELFRRSQPFINWARTNHPEALKTLRKPSGEFNYNYESGQLLRQLFSQWRDKHTEVYEAIKQRHEVSARAMEEGDVEAYVGLFAEDAVYMWPGEPAIAGHKALQTWFEKRFTQFAPEIDRTIEEIIVFDNWAVERGKEVVKIENRTTGDVQTIRGKYINLLKKQSDGSWKVARRIRNLDHPPSME